MLLTFKMIMTDLKLKMVEANKKLVMRLVSSTNAEKLVTVDATTLGADKTKIVAGRSTKEK